MSKISIFEFLQRFDTDDKCLDHIFSLKYENNQGKAYCPSCDKIQNFYKIAERKCYSCSICRHQIHPLAGTIFHKSDTPLRKWFYAMYLFSTSKNGVSAAELQRQLKVTYKCAHRIAKNVRQLFSGETAEALSGFVEVDETYYGGDNKNRHFDKKVANSQGRSVKDKQPVFGMVERGGLLKARVVGDTKSSTVMPIIRSSISMGIKVMSDEYNAYNRLSELGYDHQRVNHSVGNYVTDQAHTNTLEGFWSQLKRSISGTYHCVSKKYLQDYVNEFSWRYNHRKSETHLFDLMVQSV